LVEATHPVAKKPSERNFSPSIPGQATLVSLGSTFAITMVISITGMALNYRINKYATTSESNLALDLQPIKLHPVLTSLRLTVVNKSTCASKILTVPTDSKSELITNPTIIYLGILCVVIIVISTIDSTFILTTLAITSVTLVLISSRC
jgi:hypothetical protein